MPTEKTRKQRTLPTPEEKELFKQFREKQLREQLPYTEYTKAVKKYYKQKHKSDRKEYDQDRYAENKERLNKERVERARKKREKERKQKREEEREQKREKEREKEPEEQFAQNMIELSEALGQNNMNAGPVAFETNVPSQEYNANYSLPNNMNTGPVAFETNVPSQEYNTNYILPNNMNTGPVAFDYIPHYEEDPNSILYDEQFSDIEEPIVELGKRDRSKSPVSENKRTNVLNEKDFNLDDLKEFDGGRKTRKRRKTKKNKKRH